MEHTQNTRKLLAAGLVVVAATAGLASCATASPAVDAGLNRTLVRQSADRYVDELLEHAKAAITNRDLVRESADHYVDQLVKRGTVYVETGIVRFIPSDDDPRGHHVARESAQFLERVRVSGQQAESGVDDVLSPLRGVRE